jgi:hypothetical protein
MFWHYSGFETKVSPFFGFATRAMANRRTKSSQKENQLFSRYFGKAKSPNLLLASVIG